MTPTKRGDLVVVEYRKDYGDPSPTFELELVASVGRDGQVHATIRHSFGRDSDSEPFYRVTSSHGHPFRRFRCYSSGLCWIVGQGQLGEPSRAVFASCANRPDPVHEWSPCEFASLDAVREFLAPYRIGQVAA